METSFWKPQKYRHKNILCLEKLVLTDEVNNYRNISKTLRESCGKIAKIFMYIKKVKSKANGPLSLNWMV